MRAVWQLKLASLTQRRLQLVLIVELMLLPAEPAQPHRSNDNASGQRLLNKASTWQLTHRVFFTQGL
ncbi:hypothetical protein D3C79_1062400 [compost metagenome]